MDGTGKYDISVPQKRGWNLKGRGQSRSFFAQLCWHWSRYNVGNLCSLNELLGTHTTLSTHKQVFALFSSRFGWHGLRRWHSIVWAVFVYLDIYLSKFSGTWAWHFGWLTRLSASRRCWRWRTSWPWPGLTSSPWWPTSPSSTTPWPSSSPTPGPPPSQTRASPRRGAPSLQAAGQCHFMMVTQSLYDVTFQLNCLFK